MRPAVPARPASGPGSPGQAAQTFEVIAYVATSLRVGGADGHLGPPAGRAATGRALPRDTGFSMPADRVLFVL